MSDSSTTNLGLARTTTFARMSERPAQTETKSFAQTVRDRRAIREFKREPLPREWIEELLYEASLTPSNCNTQPWVVHIASGQTLRAIGDRLLRAHDDNDFNPDYPFDANLYSGVFQERRIKHAEVVYGAAGVSRGDVAGRREKRRRSFDFFGAPHAAFLFMPHVADGVRVASDVGMFAQTFLLALSARGLGGIPQATLSLSPAPVREILGVDPAYRLLLGISFGHIDEVAPVNSAETERDQSSFVLHD